MESTILIIDDDEKLNRLLTNFLSEFGFKTLTATHPEDGLKKPESEISRLGDTGCDAARDGRV